MRARMYPRIFGGMASSRRSPQEMKPSATIRSDRPTNRASSETSKARCGNKKRHALTAFFPDREPEVPPRWVHSKSTRRLEDPEGALNAHRQGGWPAVTAHHGHRSPGAGRALNREEGPEAQRLIRNPVPDGKKRKHATWPRQSVEALIARHLKGRLAVRAVCQCLNHSRFASQPPPKKACEQSPATLDWWVSHEYAKSAKATTTEGEEMQRGDEGGMRSPAVRGLAYALKGKTPVALAETNRSKLCVISPATNNHQMRLKVFSGDLNTEILIRFLNRLAHGRETRLLSLLDHMRVRISRAFKRWLAETEAQIALFYPPTRSPQFNLDELPNAKMEKHVTNAASARSKPPSIGALMAMLRSPRKRPTRMKRRVRKSVLSIHPERTPLRSESTMNSLPENT